MVFDIQHPSWIKLVSLCNDHALLNSTVSPPNRQNRSISQRLERLREQISPNCCRSNSSLSLLFSPKEAAEFDPDFNFDSEIAKFPPDPLRIRLHAGNSSINDGNRVAAWGALLLSPATPQSSSSGTNCMRTFTLIH
jgi:hypothetical protein